MANIISWFTHFSVLEHFFCIILTKLYPFEAETASLQAWQYMIVQEFFRYRAEKTTYKKFETA